MSDRKAHKRVKDAIVKLKAAHTELAESPHADHPNQMETRDAIITATKILEEINW